jgi:uncharacterized protein YfaP (DUF2135 family)
MKKILSAVFGFAMFFMLSFSALAGEYKVQVLHGTIKDKVIEGAEVILQKTGETSLKTVTDASGIGKFTDPFGTTDDSSISMIIKKDGFSSLVVRCPCSNLTYAISPIMNNLDGLRIILNWGETPPDLDSHLVYGNEHVFYQRKQGADANLDVDDTDSFGPETITIEKKKPIRYLYAVHNYTERTRNDSVSLSNTSKARVFVYIGSSLVRTFVPPKGKAGNVWVVFGIGENGEFYDINKFTNTVSRDDVGSELTNIIKSGDFTSVPEVTVDQKTLADSLNKQGEKAYHDGKLQDAVALYQEAINNNPEHGQAYSNLGLAYQKLKQDAEALWANQKAIAIAGGPNKKTIQASSYFNIAKIYEDQGRWKDALDNYQAARNLRTHDAYTKGIERMKKKIGN